MDFEIGRRYGNYEVIDILESSKEGIAYKVRNVLANRIEVLKALPGSSQNDQDRTERFLREVRVHAALLHPNIITFYHAAELERRVVMLSELVEGPTLAARLETGPLAWRDALHCISEVLSALAYAHAHGVVHRDLTPSKIILTPEGAVRLGGFGLAKVIADPHLTAVGTVVGSLKYISPEQVRGVQQLDGRSDIYAAGVVLYEMLTGKPPFDSKSQFEIMAAHVNEIPAPPSVLRPNVPQLLDAIVLQALAKDPAERFQTAGEFRQALDCVNATQPHGDTAALTAPAPAVAAGAANGTPVAETELLPAAAASFAPAIAAAPTAAAPANGTPVAGIEPDAAKAASSTPAVVTAPPAAAPEPVPAASAEASRPPDIAPSVPAAAGPVAAPQPPIPAAVPVFTIATARAGVPRELMLAGMLMFLVGVIAFFALR